MLFEFSHENARFEALHFHGDPKQIEKRLPLALSKLSKQNIFQMIKSLIWLIADIYRVENVLKDLLGQTGKGIGILILWDLIPATANCASMRRNQMCGSSSS